MIKLSQAVIVEGKYDKIRLSSVLDAEIITTEGFRIFKDREKLSFIRQIAKKRGIIIMTDSDSAGFMIRGHLASAVPNENIINVYVPEIKGKEKRKASASKSGLLGVEGMSEEVILSALERAGISPEKTDAAKDRNDYKSNKNKNESESGGSACNYGGSKKTQIKAAYRNDNSNKITPADLMELGLCGGAMASARRNSLKKRLGLPSSLSSRGFLQAINILYTRDEFIGFLKESEKPEEPKKTDF